MNKLNLNFLDEDSGYDHELTKVLYSYGKEIADYSQGYFDHLVTTTSTEGQFLGASLYIIVPEISNQYKILDINLGDSLDEIILTYIPLKTDQRADFTINIKNGLKDLTDKIEEILNSSLVQATFRHLISLVKLKEEALEKYNRESGKGK
ncbi:hypothetical protein MKS83_05925 [Chryseobacterium sp. Y16C]|uniref:hypothetical protein n=1 Tax=Chryseobacterium sp. Y16C TaxID=2920939 RepID=UPI001F0A587D|nr:hypothetical protein [Chryseobacterium sp. Y16C]UMQ43229.1 hypothetical protein MKS83_05925 [Chryseobacterium sp. Y16C]